MQLFAFFGTKETYTWSNLETGFMSAVPGMVLNAFLILAQYTGRLPALATLAPSVLTL